MNRQQRRRESKSREEKAFDKFVKHVREHTVPQMEKSAHVMAIAPARGDHSIKLAIEIGLCILMDKPLIVFVPDKERPTCERLLRIADHVIEADMTSAAGQAEAQKKLEHLLKQ